MRLLDAQFLETPWYGSRSTSTPCARIARFSYVPPAPERSYPQRKGRAVAACASSGGRAPGQPRRGAKAHAALRLKMDRPMGDGQEPLLA